MVEEKSRILPIDGLRGIAALVVALYHYHTVTGMGKFLDLRAFKAGLLGVDLFFILSGIIITYIYEDKIVRGATSFKSFMVARLARLYPLHFITFFIMLFLEVISFFWLKQGHIITDPASPTTTAFFNLTLLQNIGFYQKFANWNDPSWSISAEIAVNIFWFWLAANRKNTSTLYVFLIWLTLAVIPYFEVLKPFFLLNRALAGFLVGCLLYRHCIANGALNKIPVVSANVMAALLVIFIPVALIWPDQPLLKIDGSIFVIAIFPLLILLALHAKTFLRSRLESRVAVVLGHISYSVYLLHWPMILIILHFIGQPGSKFWQAWYLVMLLLLSYLSYRYVETPLRSKMRVMFKEQTG